MSSLINIILSPHTPFIASKYQKNHQKASSTIWISSDQAIRN